MILTVASANLLRSLNDRRFAAELDRLVGTHEPDLAGLQEVTKRNLPALVRPDYTPVQPRVPRWAAANAILLGPDFRLVEVQVVPVHPPSAFLAGRSITVATALHKPSRRTVSLVDTHLDSHLEKNGHPRDLPRIDDAADHLWLLRQVVDSLPGLVFVTGDFNVDYPADRRVRSPRFPYTMLERRGPLVSNWSALGVPTGTHGDRAIDYVYFRPSPHLKPRRQVVLPRRYSDHRPLIVTFDLEPL